MTTTYKVNLHLLEGCNFHCKFCFAKFDSKGILNVVQWKYIMKNLKDSGLVSSVNFAGGEPLAYYGLQELLEYTQQLQLKASIITNGSLMTAQRAKEIAPYVDMIGFSIDSFNEKTSVKLGRCDKSSKTFGKNELSELCKVLEQYKVKIKINTVVNKLNYTEKVSASLQGLPIARWKVFKMKPFDNGTFSNKWLNITDEQFQYFLQRNPHINRVSEDSMVNSYFIVDANGNLIDNQQDKNVAVGSLLTESFESVKARYNFDEALYQSRYSQTKLLPSVI